MKQINYVMRVRDRKSNSEWSALVTESVKDKVNIYQHAEQCIEEDNEQHKTSHELLQVLPYQDTAAPLAHKWKSIKGGKVKCESCEAVGKETEEGDVKLDRAFKQYQYMCPNKPVEAAVNNGDRTALVAEYLAKGETSPSKIAKAIGTHPSYVHQLIRKLQSIN